MKGHDGVQLALFAVPAVALVVLAVRFGGPIAGLDSLLPPVLVLAAVGFAVVAFRCSKAAGPAKGYQRVTVHTHGGHGPRVAARHEAGHVHMAKALGARVHSAEIRRDGSGVTVLDIPGRLSAAQRVAISVSGEVASFTKEGCGSDQAFVREDLARLPSHERAAARSAGYALARRTVGGWVFDGGVSSTADQLMKKGRVNY